MNHCSVVKSDNKMNRSLWLITLVMVDLVFLVGLSGVLIDYGAILVLILSLISAGAAWQRLRSCESYLSKVCLVSAWSCGTLLIVFCSVLIFGRRSFMEEVSTGTVLQWSLIRFYLLIAFYITSLSFSWRLIMVSVLHRYCPAKSG